MKLAINAIEQTLRARRDLGNLNGLVESIRSRGLLHPPAVRADGDRWVLIAGARRLEAIRRIGWIEVDVTVITTADDELSALRAEGEENSERKAFTPSEAADLAERIEGVIAAEAKTRKGGRGKRAETGGNLSPVSKEDRKTEARTAKAVGMSRGTLAKARRVKSAATDKSLPPAVQQVARDAVAEMDRTGKVDPAFKRVERAKSDASAEAEFIEAVTPQSVAWRRRFLAALEAVAQPTTFPVEDVARHADPDDVDDLERLAVRITTYAAAARTAWDEQHAPGLHLVKERSS